MSMGSLSQDPLFQAFSTSMNNPNTDGGSDSVARSPMAAPCSENFPAGSRLFAYMQPAHISRKSSHSSTDAQATLATSPSSPAQFGSVMSPYANTFQPSSSSKQYGQGPPFNTAKMMPVPSLEHKFAQAMTMRDHEYQPRMQQIPAHPFDAAALHLGHSTSTPAFNSLDGSGNVLHNYAANDFNAGSLPTPPNSVAPASSMSSMSGMGRKISKSPVAPYGGSNIAESIGGTTYFFNTPPFDTHHTHHAQGLHEEQTVVDGNPESSLLMPEFYAYTGPPANVGHFKPRSGLGFASYFAPNEIKMELMHRQILCMAQVDPEEFPDLPQEIDCYHRLVPLETSSMGMMPDRPGYFGVVTTVYKATSTKNGLAYCLRRIHNYRLTNMRCLTAIETWKKLQHSNIVQIREVFTTKAFGDNSVVFVYDYYPTAETLKSRHFSRPSSSPNGFASSSVMDEFESQRQPGQPRMVTPKGIRGGAATAPGMHAVNGGSGLLPEAFIWCYVIQLSSALRQIHSAGLAARTIDPSKILVVGKSRLLINCCGLFDLLSFEQLQQSNLIQHYQQEDLLNFGRVVLALACNNAMAAMQQHQLQNSIEFVARHYSPDLKNLILYLVTPQRIRNVNDVMPMIGARFYTQLETAQNRIDILETELTKEADNGRLFRLLCKLGTVNERPEHAMDSQWSETGDRYLLKLFRDHLFHQVAEDGRPWIDLAHTVQCLNKLDAGVPEKVMLSSRDQQNVLIVSYADLHRCLDQAFQELSRHNATMDLAAANAGLIEQSHYPTPPGMSS